jgi:WD40 repeat protein
LISRGFHSRAITTLDCATQRPLLLTCSYEDCSIRLWNYEQSVCELGKEFFVAPVEDQLKEIKKILLSVTMHPSGYILAASTLTKIRLYHIM